MKERRSTRGDPDRYTLELRLNRARCTFPVRLYDYDIDGVDEPDFDEEGRACVISEFDPQPA